MSRIQLIRSLADAAESLQGDLPVLVGIDGKSAAGKTTLADELAAELKVRGNVSFRASIDDFHTPGYSPRSRQGGFTPRELIDEGFDYRTFVDRLLSPLRQRGPRRCLLAYWNAGEDCAIKGTEVDVPDGAVVVVDGAFIFRPEILPFWDLRVWLEIDFATMLGRALQRDIAWSGPAEQVERKYREKWGPAHEIYEREVNPRSLADAVVENSKFDSPALAWRAAN